MEIRHGSMKKFMKGNRSVQKYGMRISEDSVDALNKHLEEYAEIISRQAKVNARHAGRVTIKVADIELAIDQMM